MSTYLCSGLLLGFDRFWVMVRLARWCSGGAHPQVLVCEVAHIVGVTVGSEIWKRETGGVPRIILVCRGVHVR